MPIKRRSNKRKFKRALKKYFRKRPLRSIARSNALVTKRFVFKQVYAGSDATPSLAAGLTFSLADVPAYTEFTSLFEEYKIAGIAYRFVITRNPDLLAVNKGYIPRVMFCHDHTDSTTPSGFAELQQYPKVKEIWLRTDYPASKWYWLKPNTIDVGYTSGVASNYGVNYKRWIDASNSSTPYYGLKFIYDQLYAGMQLFVECKYYMKFKGVK